MQEKIGDYRYSTYFHIGRSEELSGRDRLLYKLFELFPGTLAWLTLLVTILLSIYAPFYAALFIIAFDTYWLLKIAYLSIHLYSSFRRVKQNMELDWGMRLSTMRHDHIYHLVILPFYEESLPVVEGGIKSILAASWDPKKIILVVATEERAGEKAQTIARTVMERYGKTFGHVITTTHPKDVPGELQGKGANITYASEKARTEIVDPAGIPYQNIIVSAFDIDTVVYPAYFQCLTWNFLTSPRPHRTSFQPVPFYNNNTWDVPALSRVTSTSGTFWQMIQQERPEKLVTFSSHAISFQTLYELGYWQKNVVSDDSRIFWNAYMAYDSDYTVTPLFYPLSMDANLAPSFWQTMKNVYKQQRRWMWGVDNMPYIMFSFIKNKNIPLKKKIRTILIQIDGYWSLATNPLFIALLGWFPLILGGPLFNQTILSYNLPIVTQDLMILSMVGLIFEAILSFSFLPPPPAGAQKIPMHKAVMFIAWFFVPITIIIFGSIPGLDAQTRLMFGKYMGFWVTPKHRKT